MIITAHGHASYRFSYGTTTVLTNPRSKDSTYGAVKGSYDVALSNVIHADYALADPYGDVNQESLQIAAPGVYGPGDLNIFGYEATMAPEASDNNNKSLGAVYTFQMEGLTVCTAGPLASTDFPPVTQEALASVEVLLVPIAGGAMITAAEAYKLAVDMEVRLVIPMLYDLPGGDSQALDTFLKEAGGEVMKTNKFSFKPKDLPSEGMQVVVVEPEK